MKRRDFLKTAAAGPWVRLRLRLAARMQGIVSAESYSAGGEILTRPLRFVGRQLQVNCDAGVGGRLRVAVENADGGAIPGFSAQQADAINGNQVSAVASWKGNSYLHSLLDRPRPIAVSNGPLSPL